MGRAPCCDKANVKKGPWSPEEDFQLKDYIEKYGTGGNWIALPQKAGLRRCGKSCRLRWLNYLRPNIKHGEFSAEEDRIIYTLFATIGSRWSIIAAQLPGRTDNDIKNYWNTKLKKKLIGMASTPQIRRPQSSSHQNAASQPLSSLSRSDSISNHVLNSTTCNTYCYEPSISIPFNCSNAIISSCNLVTNPFESQSSQFHTTLKPGNHLHFDQGSCSSSDGGYATTMGYESSNFIPNGFEERKKSMNNNNNSVGFGKELTDYDLEDVKQLISSSSSNNEYYNSCFLNVDDGQNHYRTQAEEKYYSYYHC